MDKPKLWFFFHSVFPKENFDALARRGISDSWFYVCFKFLTNLLKKIEKSKYYILYFYCFYKINKKIIIAQLN